ncbi:hypothetical protein BGP_6107 [Beggiatoa sp. PS]|nr:hypothetical protein BGP_6107 [Beggiatoa sp. PS]
MKKDKAVCPIIILARTFSDFVSNKERISFLETVVKDAKPYIQWASTHIYLSDDIARRSPLWLPTCTNKQPSVIASAELLAASIIRGETNIDNVLAPFKPKDCDNTYVSPNLTENINISGLSIKPINRQRIFYSIPWLVVDTPPKLPYTIFDNSGVPMLKILSAQSYAESSSELNLEIPTDSIVVISGSYGYGKNYGPFF